MSKHIHPTALVDPEAQLAEDVSIGAYSIIGPEVVLGARAVVHNHVTITGKTTLGEGARIHPGAVLGGPPQDLKYKGEPTTLTIGDETIIRECCTLNPGTALGGGQTVVGRHNLIMAYVHIAHDCRLGDHIVIANATQLAGHVRVQEGARISGLAAIHHFVRIGRGSFVAGCAKLSIDVPPFTLAEGHPARIRGLNLEGLKRREVPPEELKALKAAYRVLFREKGRREEAYGEIQAAGWEAFPIVSRFVEFVRETDAGRNGRALEAERVLLPPGERDGALGLWAEEAGLKKED